MLFQCNYYLITKNQMNVTQSKINKTTSHAHTYDIKIYIFVFAVNFFFIIAEKVLK
jgi:hypothetical protein